MTCLGGVQDGEAHERRWVKPSHVGPTYALPERPGRIARWPHGADNTRDGSMDHTQTMSPESECKQQHREPDQRNAPRGLGHEMAQKVVLEVRLRHGRSVQSNQAAESVS
jgi:hypothetical protein